MNLMSDYSEYDGKKVLLTLNGEDSEPKEGTIMKGSALGVLFKTKGKTGMDLFEPSQIADIEVAPEKVKPLKAKTLKEVDAGKVKQHLLDRHGYKLSDINAMEETAALDFHESLDHSDLGHTHKGADEGDSTEENEGSDAE